MNTRAELTTLIPLLIILALILPIPHYLRPDSLGFIGDYTYYSLRIAESPLATTDPLSYGGRELGIKHYPLLLGGLSDLTSLPTELLTQYLPYLFGILTLILLYFILRKHNFSKLFTTTALAIFTISPPFLYLTNTITPHAIILPLLLGAYLATIYQHRFLRAFLLIIAASFGLFIALLIVALLAVKTFTTKKFPFITAALVLITAGIPYFFYGIPVPAPDLASANVAQNFIAGLGGFVGFSIFVVILAFFGIRHLWKEKYTHLPFYLLTGALLIISIIEPTTLIYLNIPIIVLATLGLSHLLNLHWQSPILQHIIVGILILGIIFSTLLYLQHFSIAEPTQEVFEAFVALEEETMSSNIVIASHPDNGHWITSIGNRTNVMDTEFLFAPEPQERWEDLQTLFYSRDFSETERIIRKYDIDAIYIDEEMKNGKVWNSPQEGLLFFLTSSNKFKRVYSSETVELWSVKL